MKIKLIANAMYRYKHAANPVIMVSVGGLPTVNQR